MKSPVRDWTEGKFKSFIVSLIRSGFRKFPNKYNVLREALIGKEINPASGRLANMYMCRSCKGKFPATKVQVDHIEPVVNPKTGFTTWDDFITRMYCEEKGLQVLCTDCHDTKTKQERQKRKE